MRAGARVLRAGHAARRRRSSAPPRQREPGQLLVTRRPVVSVLCTGDELRAPGEPLGPGEIHNSNAPMLTALAQRAGAVSPPGAAVARRSPRRPRPASPPRLSSLRRRRDLGRSLGRPARPRKARAGRSGGERALLACGPATRESRRGSAPGTGSSCSACPAIRSRPWSPSRCSSRRRSARCSAPGPTARHAADRGARGGGATEPDA